MIVLVLIQNLALEGSPCPPGANAPPAFRFSFNVYGFNFKHQTLRRASLAPFGKLRTGRAGLKLQTRFYPTSVITIMTTGTEDLPVHGPYSTFPRCDIDVAVTLQNTLLMGIVTG